MRNPNLHLEKKNKETELLLKCIRISYEIPCLNWYRFLQGPETDPATVRKIREAIDNQREVTVQLINYSKSGTYL